MTIKITTNFDNLDQTIADVKAKLAADLYADLILNTPVDTGALRNAWDLDAESANPVITNAMPYARRLMQDGHSKQAPAGTLDAIVDRHTDRGK